MRFAHGATAALSLVTLAAAQTKPVCQKGVHIISARASGEPAGFGGLAVLKNQILSKIPGSDAVAVPYPASIGGAITYTVSEPEGAGNTTSLVTQYGDACPDSKMVLMGYSQGAQAIADALLGIDYEKFPGFGTSQGLAQKYIDKIVAVIMMGDPSNVVGQPILVGTSTRSGVFPRNNTAKWSSTGLFNKTKSYCDSEDFFCDSGYSIQVHVGYVAKYGTQAVNYVVNKFKASMSGSGSGSGSESSSGSASISATDTSAPQPTMSAPVGSTPAPSLSTPASGSTPSPGSATSNLGGATGAATAPTPTGTGAASTLGAGSIGNVASTLLACIFAVVFYQ